MNKSYIWFNDQILDNTKACLAMSNHSLHYGTGVFEGIRSYSIDNEPFIFELEKHIDRLLNSAETMRIHIAYSKAKLIDGCIQVLKANELTNAYLRPIIYIDDHYGAAIHSNGIGKVAIFASATNKTDDLITRKAIISSLRRNSANSSYHHAKTTGLYSTIHYAMGECLAQDVDQAIFLDNRNVVCECLTDNIFIVSKGSVITPPAHLPIIQGITRETVIKLLHGAGIETIEREFGVKELQNADEIFTTGTASEVQAITHLNNLSISNGQPGSITRKASQLYNTVKRCQLSQVD